MPATPSSASRRRLLTLLLPCALAVSDARAIVINEHAFQRLGGKLADIEGTAALVDQQLLEDSRKPRFHSAGLLKLGGIDRPGCHQTNATWLGEDASFVYLLAGASCLSGQGDHARTRLAQVEFLDWRGLSVVSGEARIFFPPHGNATTLALVRVPRPVDKPLDLLRPLLPPVWINASYRFRDLQVNQPFASMEVVGYGQGGVGNIARAVSARRFGIAVRKAFDARVPNLMYLDYDARTDTDSWARAGLEDDGSGWYERHDREGMLTGLTYGFSVTRSRTRAARVAPYARWIEGLYPGVRISRETAHAFNGSWAEAYPLTERRALITTDLSLDGLTGQRRQGLYFPVPSVASGWEELTEPPPPPPPPIRSGTPGHTSFQVKVKDEQSSVETLLTLRGQKMTPCAGLLAMNDSHDCAEGGDGRLMLSYWPEDNPSLARGRVFVGTFEIGAVFDRGPEGSALRFTRPDVWRVDLRIATREQGRVTATTPFQWDYQGAVHRAGAALKDGEVRRPNRFTFKVLAQSGVQEPVEVQTNKAQPYRLIAVLAHDVLQQTSDWQPVSPNSFDRHMPTTTRVVHLRAKLGGGCGESGPCAPQDWKRRLTISFAKEDNPELPAGIYRGRFDIDGSHVSGAGAEQNKLSVEVDIDTL